VSISETEKATQCFVAWLADTPTMQTLTLRGKSRVGPQSIGQTVRVRLISMLKTGLDLEPRPSCLLQLAVVDIKSVPFFGNGGQS
jgi:hypothetical protein